MSKWYKPRMHFRMVGEHIRDAWTVEFDANDEIPMVAEFHFNTRKDAEDFYELNREETYYVPGTDNPDSEVH